MSKIRVSSPEILVNGKQISFISPCSSADTECLVINGVEYSVVDSDGVSVAGLHDVWNSGAVVSIIINTDTKTAFVQNANTNTYIEGQFQTQTQKLLISDALTIDDTIPFFSLTDKSNRQVTLRVLKDVIGVKSPTINVTACEGATVTCSSGTDTFTGAGSTKFSDVYEGTWTITSTLNGRTATTTVEVQGAIQYNVDLRIIRAIDVTSLPEKTTYFVGEAFDDTGMVVMATYEDGTTADVTTHCKVNPTVIQDGVHAVNVSYDKCGLSANVDVAIHVRALTDLSITTPPTKTSYIHGQEFETAGMIVTAVYDDGLTRVVTGWTYSPSNGLTVNDEAVTIRYTENGVTKTCTQKVSVANVVVNVEITTPPTRTEYFAGDTFDVSGMVVTASMADGVTKIVTNYTISPATIGADTTHIVVSYEEDGAVVFCNQPISVVTVSSVLDYNDWETIKRVSDEGKAANYWSVGDSKRVTLNGTVGRLTFSNNTYCCFIIGFDHNSSKEGHGIHFQFGKTVEGKDIAFVDDGYGSSQHNFKYFRMSAYGTSDGWKNSYMRQTICPEFLKALPSDLQAVISSCTKYSSRLQPEDEEAGTDREIFTEYTSDKIWLLSYYEVYANATYGKYENSSEKYYTSQYAYYAAGNSNIKYRHTSTANGAGWWLRSISTNGSSTHMCVNHGVFEYSSYSLGLAPGFKV